MNQTNGQYHCQYEKDLLEDFDERLRETQYGVRSMNKYASHLEKLDKLDVIASSITEMKDKLLKTAIDKDSRATKTMGWVILALASIIVFLLVGEMNGWIGTLHR